MQPRGGGTQSAASRRLLAVHAHPDDETISMGGTLARCSAEGAHTVVVTCTLGEAGDIRAPDRATPETLGEVRRQELAEAAHLLGVSRVALLGYRDSGMKGMPDNAWPESFEQAPIEEAVERLVCIVREERPQVVLTYDPQGAYGHPDHVKAHRVAVVAFFAARDPTRFPDAGPPWAPVKLYHVVYPRSQVETFNGCLRQAGLEAPYSAISGGDASLQDLEFGVAEDEVTTAIDVSNYVEVKRAALAAHRTQMTGHYLTSLSSGALARAWAAEYYALAAGPLGSKSGERETDLFAGILA